MTVELYNDGQHICMSFPDLVDDTGQEAVQSNQFLIVDNGHGALIDPGGSMTFSGLTIGMSRYFSYKNLDCILASHQDPDIVSALNRWLVQTECKVYAPKIWERFLPYYCSVGNTAGRIVGIPDPGMNIPLGKSVIKAIPAHFLHSEGNFQFYDTVSKILFSGDMGASLVHHEEAAQPVTDFESHLRTMEGFHRRYMVSNKACRLWVNMVRQLDVEWIVPQHGRSFKGKAMINKFLDWIEKLECGIDLFNQDNYKIP